jgi:predicted ATPase
MRITYFRIENFKSIRLAECTSPPDFMVVCGGNGCGKSALLSALVLAKETAGAYGGSPGPQPASISADATQCRIILTLAFDEVEQAFLRAIPNLPAQYPATPPFLDSTATVEVTLRRDQSGQPWSSPIPEAVRRLLSAYSRVDGSPGFFDFIDAHRVYPRMQVSSWEPQSTSDDAARATLVVSGQDQVGPMHPPQGSKFLMTKRYLADMVMRDLQELQRSQRNGSISSSDSLAEFRQLFNEFLAPLKFVEVDISVTPFRYIVSTPRGEIDIDDLSSGEKEVLNVFVRFHQLRPERSIIFFDEADAHLHPDLQRRYLGALRSLAKGNQLWLTTHSPEIMFAAGSDHLYTIARVPQDSDANQFLRVTQSDQLHEVLSEVMGSRGLVSFNQRIVFIEGDESSADRAIYEALYPPGVHNVSFVPVGNSATARKTAERVNDLLTSAPGFQFFYSIVDGDIDRSEPDPTNGTRLFRLPVYHVENLLLDEESIFRATKAMLGTNCPVKDTTDVGRALTEGLLDDVHLKPFTKALLDAKLAGLAKRQHDAVYSKSANGSEPIQRPEYSAVEREAEAILTEAIARNEWKARCKGRDLLKAYCGRLGMKYEHFRNCVISNLSTPPPALVEIMRKILGQS